MTWQRRGRTGSKISYLIRGEPRIHEIQEVALYIFVCGVIISMRKDLNFQSRTWVMIVKHVHIQL